MADASVRALILAGGSGTRLWPRSTDSRPKPFLALAGGESLLRETYRRAAAVAGPDRVFVSGRASHAALLSAELPEVPESRLVLEPVRRNTAPAIALSALAACADDANAVLLVLPSDQAVADEPAFLAALRAGAAVAAREDAFVTLGIPPTRPETGYGYMEMPKRPKRRKRFLRVEERGGGFVEKARSLARAAEFLASGRFLWNAGIFLFKASLLFEELARTAPAVLDAARRAWAAHRAGDLSFIRRNLLFFPFRLHRRRRHGEGAARPHGPLRLRLERPRVVGGRLRVPGRAGPARTSSRATAPPRAARGTSSSRGARPVRVVGLSGVAVVESPDGLLVMKLGASDDLRRAVEKRPEMSERPVSSPGAAGVPAAPAVLASIARLVATVRTAYRGPAAAVEDAVVCLLARGHLLIEDVPGVGKTTLATALGKALGVGRPPPAVHARHAPERHPRPDGLQPARAGVRVPPRARSSRPSSSPTRSTARRRRRSPRCCRR